MKSAGSLVNRDPVRLDSELVIGGLTPLTTIDYPGELAAVVFLQGCPWRCGYCHNDDLLPRQGRRIIAWPEVIGFLRRRKGLLDAVVFSGGEPTLHTGLGSAMRQVRSLGFKVGLHTAGIYPRRLHELLPLVDWVGMDIKAARADYDIVTGSRGSGKRAWESARLLIESGVAHEFRTTVHPDMINRQQLATLVHELSCLGASHYAIQECLTKNCVDDSRRVTLAPRIDRALLQQFGTRFNDFTLRLV